MPQRGDLGLFSKREDILLTRIICEERTVRLPNTVF